MLQLHPPPTGPVDLEALYAHAPGVRLGMLTSVDGATALDGSSRGLSGEADRLLIGLLRAQADVVLVGAGTARAEGYGPLRVRLARQEQRLARGQAALPVLAVLSRGAGLAGDLGPGSLLLVPAGSDPLVPRGASVVHVDPARPASVLEALRARGLTRVLCEGGPELAGALVAADLVDEVCVTTGPQLVGGPSPRMLSGAPHSLRPLRLAHVLTAEQALFCRWTRPPRDLGARP